MLPVRLDSQIASHVVGAALLLTSMFSSRLAVYHIEPGVYLSEASYVHSSTSNKKEGFLNSELCELSPWDMER